jgi:hypothetical protein
MERTSYTIKHKLDVRREHQPGVNGVMSSHVRGARQRTEGGDRGENQKGLRVKDQHIQQKALNSTFVKTVKRDMMKAIPWEISSLRPGGFEDSRSVKA